MCTEVIMTTLSPSWNPFTLELRDIASNEQMLTFEVWDWDKNGSHDYIGTIQTNINSIIRNTGQEIPLKGESKKSVGKLIFQSVDNVQASPIPLAFRVKFRAKNLPRMDKMGLGKSDPFLEIWGSPNGTGRQDTQCLIQRTTYLKNELNPIWEEIEVQVDTAGGLDATLTIRVIDHDNDGTHDFIGSVKLTLRSLTFPGQKWPLINTKATGLMRKNAGILFVASIQPTAPDYSLSSVSSFKIRCRGKSIERKDMMGLGKSDPYIIIKRFSDGVELHHSEIVKSNLNPHFEPFTLSVQGCGGLDGPLIIEIWDWDRITKDDFIAKFVTTLRALSLYHKDNQFFFFNPAKINNVTYRNSGSLIIDEMIPSDVINMGNSAAAAGRHTQPNYYINPNTGIHTTTHYGTANPHTANSYGTSHGNFNQQPLYPSNPQASYTQPPLYPSNSSNTHTNPTQTPLYPSSHGSQAPLYPSQSNTPPSYHNHDSGPPPAYCSTQNQSYSTAMMQQNVPSYASAARPADGNLPSYITGSNKSNTPMNTKADYSSSNTYSDANPPAYLSNLNAKQVNPPQSNSRPHGYY